MGRLAYDVLVIGAGPAGSYTAELLAAAGYRVAILEQREALGGRGCCTGILGWECLEMFPIPSNLILKTAHSACIFSPSGKRLRLFKEKPQAHIVDREAFDIMRARMAQRQGAELLLGHRVLNVGLDDGGARVEYQLDGSRASLCCRAVVIANGFASGLAQRLGLGSPPDFVLGAQVDVAVKDVDEVEVYLGQEVAPGFFGWLVPTAPGEARLGLMTRRHPLTYLERLYHRLHTEGKVVAELAPPASGGIPLKPLPRTYASRVVVVGDAAGQVKPTTGGGIYYSLLCAQAAAAALETALSRNDLSGRQLSQYEQAWKRRLQRELRIGYYARHLYEKAGDSQIERLFDIIMCNGIHDALLKSESFSFDWHGDLLFKAVSHYAMRSLVESLRQRLPLV